MEWIDRALVLSTRPYSDHKRRVMLMTVEHGRHAGMATLSRRQGGAWLPGTLVQARWRARLSEHLGTLTLESESHEATRLIQHKGPFAALLSACALIEQCLPEREPNPMVFDDLWHLVRALHQPDWPKTYALFEVYFLQHLGFRLDLSQCAVTGEPDDLLYVSPRSGRAVSRTAGEPYADRLFLLPAFFKDPEAAWLPSEIAAALKMTGFFIDRSVLSPLGQALPPIRDTLLQRILAL